MRNFPCTSADNKMADENGEFFDELYDQIDNETEEAGAHRSVIMHLASQLTRNMDISRLSLPVCLCERRSILETYSDYFSRTGTYLNIARQKTPDNRMAAFLKWYLSTFNASRKSTLAKKPYNPILGEVFKCQFKVVDNDKEITVSYISEQVSHHPPILAFRVEDDCKLMSLSCQIHLKTRFLGLSVAIEMIGEAKLTLHQFDDEEYIMTFPTAYCNSIYTTPWLELGGKTQISCAQTGYHTKINFKRHAYFGGQKDKVEASIFQTKEAKVVLSVKGNWNGILMSRNSSDDVETMFMDVLAIPIVKAHVMPRSRQAEYESRKVWEEVTFHLKEQNLKAATEAKIMIEQAQRNFLSCRLLTGTKWEPRFFKMVGDRFEYNEESNVTSSAE